MQEHDLKLAKKPEEITNDQYREIVDIHLEKVKVIYKETVKLSFENEYKRKTGVVAKMQRDSIKSLTVEQAISKIAKTQELSVKLKESYEELSKLFDVWE